MTRKSSRSTATVINGVLYTEDSFTGTRVGSDEWFEVIASGKTFYFDDIDDIGFTVRSEKRRQGLSWYAFKRKAGKLHKVYVGRSVAINLTRLREVALLLFED